MVPTGGTSTRLLLRRRVPMARASVWPLPHTLPFGLLDFPFRTSLSLLSNKEPLFSSESDQFTLAFFDLRSRTSRSGDHFCVVQKNAQDACPVANERRALLCTTPLDEGRLRLIPTTQHEGVPRRKVQRHEKNERLTIDTKGAGTVDGQVVRASSASGRNKGVRLPKTVVEHNLAT